MTSVDPRSSTRKAAVIGAGQTGVTAALGLLDAGFDVTLYSERDQPSLRNDVPPTGTALEFGETQQAEAALGLDTYTARAPRIGGLNVRIAGQGAELIAFDGRFQGYAGVAVDTRLKADERLSAFQARGGKFRVERVTPQALDAIAGAHALTLVATGKAGLSDLFAPDNARTIYAAPQRSVLTIYVTGLGFGRDVFAHRSPAGGEHALFSILAEQGEAYWGPYLHKDVGPSWAFLGWARPGSDWEQRFSQAHDAASTLAIVKRLYRDYLDWDLPEIEQTQIIEEDPHSWLKGAVRPIVRAGVGHTASGHVVASLGDTSVAYDPIAGQGAQSGLIQAQRLVAAAAVHGGAFDAAWLQAQYESFLAARADAANKVTSLFLSDPALGHIANQFFPAAQVDPKFASALVALLHRPEPLLAVNTDADAATYIEKVTGVAASEVLAKFAPVGKFSRSQYVPAHAR